MFRHGTKPPSSTIGHAVYDSTVSMENLKNESALWPLSLQAMPALKSGGCHQVPLQLQSPSFLAAVPGSTLDADSSVRSIGSRMLNCTPGPLPESRPSCCGIFTDRSSYWIWVPHMGPTSEGRSWQPSSEDSQGVETWCGALLCRCQHRNLRTETEAA